MEDNKAAMAWVRYLLAALMLAALLYAQKIIVSFPAYDVILQEAFPNAEVVLLTKGAGDPHEYQFTAGDLQLLRGLGERDVVVLTMHAPFELKIAELARKGEIKARIIDVTQFQQYLRYENGALNPHDHGIYPPNVFKLVEAVSGATGLQPSAEFIKKLRELNATYCCRFGGKAVAITPAAQYLLHWLGFRDVVVLVKEPGVPPSAEDLQKALQYVKEGAPAVAAVVRGEALRIVQMFTQKAQEAGIQPKVVTADFSKGYLSTLENTARQIAEATPPSEATQTAAETSTPAQQDLALQLAAVAVAAFLVAVLAAVMWRKKK